MAATHDTVTAGACTERAPAPGIDRGGALVWVASLGLRSAVEIILRRDGFHVTAVGAAPVVLRLLVSAHLGLRPMLLPSLVVIDVPVPDDGSLDVVARVRRIEPGLRILALVSRHDRGRAIEAYQRGATRVVAKPFVLDALHRAAIG